MLRACANKGIAFDDRGDAKEIRRNLGTEPLPDKDRLLAYMSSREPTAVAPGLCFDHLNGKTSIGAMTVYADDAFFWDNAIIFYFDKYNLELDPAFVDHVLEQ